MLQKTQYLLNKNRIFFCISPFTKSVQSHLVVCKHLWLRKHWAGVNLSSIYISNTGWGKDTAESSLPCRQREATHQDTLFRQLSTLVCHFLVLLLGLWLKVYRTGMGFCPSKSMEILPLWNSLHGLQTQGKWLCSAWAIHRTLGIGLGQSSLFSENLCWTLTWMHCYL